jgi:hypothetical protein
MEKELSVAAARASREKHRVPHAFHLDFRDMLGSCIVLDEMLSLPVIPVNFMSWNNRSIPSSTEMIAMLDFS